MGNEIERFPVLRFTEHGKETAEEAVAREFAVTIILNNQELVTLPCSPKNLEYLAVGFLCSEGLLRSKDEVKKVVVTDERGTVRVETVEGEWSTRDALFSRIITSGSERGASFYRAPNTASRKVESRMEISPGEVFTLAKRFQHMSEVYLATHGVHSSALCDRKRVLAFSEDISRHNAIAKVFGKCLLEDIPTEDRLIITSCRISSDILRRAARVSIPVVISISVPTSLGVSTADDLGITLIGSVTGTNRMNVFTHGWRIRTE